MAAPGAVVVLLVVALLVVAVVPGTGVHHPAKQLAGEIGVGAALPREIAQSLLPLPLPHLLLLLLSGTHQELQCECSGWSLQANTMARLGVLSGMYLHNRETRRAACGKTLHYVNVTGLMVHPGVTTLSSEKPVLWHSKTATFARQEARACGGEPPLRRRMS